MLAPILLQTIATRTAPGSNSNGASDHNQASTHAHWQGPDFVLEASRILLDQLL
jgi:hypothetical protein